MIVNKDESGERRALRQFTLSTGKSAGRNSSGRITLFHRGGGSKRLQRRIDLKRSTSSMGIVERIEYDPNRSSRIALVRWKGGAHQRKCKTIEEFAPPKKRLESTTTTIRGPFAFSSLPGKVDQRKVACFSPGLMAVYVVVGLPYRMPSWSKSHFTSKGAGSKKTCAKDVFFSAFSSPKAKGEIYRNKNVRSFGFPRIAVAGAKPAFFVFRMREKENASLQVCSLLGGKNTFSLCEIRKWRTHSILWAHRIKRKAALSWQSFRRQEILGLVGASSHNESKPKQRATYLELSQRVEYLERSLLFREKKVSIKKNRQCNSAKAIDEGPKNGTCKALLYRKEKRAPVTYIIASHQFPAGKMVMNWSKPSTSDLLRPAQNANTY